MLQVLGSKTTISARSATQLQARLAALAVGKILTTLLPMLAGTAENVDIGSVIGQAVGGGVAGAIVTFVVGLIKNTMVGQTAK